ncbi:MAG: hypothetical protein M3357_05655 [Actinomycetota bacterium]|nr:hypothetical protein [Actinomycetota bacterium]
MDPVAAVYAGGGPFDDGAGVGDGAVDDVVVGGEEQSEDGGDAGFGFAGELDLDRGVPAPPARVGGNYDAVGEEPAASRSPVAGRALQLGAASGNPNDGRL